MTSIRLFFSAFVLLVVGIPLGHAQPASNATVGTLVYFEGSVDVKPPNEAWSAATIDQALEAAHRIRTGPTATADIEWKNGTKSTLGPNSTQEVGPLFESVSERSSEASTGVVNRFVELFQGKEAEGDEVGGIRRSNVQTDVHSGPGELYWKTIEEASFSEAQTALQDGEYQEAVRTFHLFLQQNPDHANAPKAQLGLGVSYLKLNNPAQARSALEALVSKYSDTPVADRGRTLLDRL